MKLQPKRYQVSKFSQRWLLLVLGLALSAGLFGSLAWLVHAEGSRSMFPAGVGGFRANLEWRNSFYGNNFLRRRTLLQLYMEQNEVALMGSSAVGVDNGDILIYPSSEVSGRVGDETLGTPAFTCNQQRATVAPNLGRIDSRAQELAGPDTINPATGLPAGSVPNGYPPCYFQAPSAGIYYVVFYGPAGDGSDAETAPTGSIDPIDATNSQNTSVSAWDITVRSALDDPNDITGRLFADYLALFTGANPRPMFSTLYILTIDGYIYQVDLNGLDPNGFMVFANNTGFLNSDGTPLNHNLVATTNQLNDPQGGVTLSEPLHKLFFEEPSEEAIRANNITTDPPLPFISSFEFQGSIGPADTAFGAGGTFIYDSNINGVYELIISRDGINFDPTEPQNRVLRGILPDGQQSVPWDGLDNSGAPFPPGLGYQARLVVRGGEYHFPLLDIENSEGGPTYTLLNPPGGDCPSFNGQPRNCNIAFYDDRGYVTDNGTEVGTDGQVLPGNGPTNPPRSDPLAGFDTSPTGPTPNQRRFGDFQPQGTGFGDKKGLDLWTYFPSEAQLAVINIFGPDLAITKTDGGITTQAGGTIVYTLTYSNVGVIDATGVVISETVPANTTFSAANSPAGWSCADGSPAGTECLFQIGPLATGANDSVEFAVTVTDPLPANVTQIDNTVWISDDGSQGPDPTPQNNVDTEDTPVFQQLPSPDLAIEKTDGGIITGPGGNIIYSLVYTNISAVNATGVVISETVPANTTFNAASSTAGWSCADGSPAGTECLLQIGALAGGAGGQAIYAVIVANPLPANVTRIDNTVRISDDGSQGPDPTPQNNVDTEDTPVSQLGPGPDLAIEKTDGGISSGPGGIIPYRLDYSNISNINATGVVISEIVPANTTFSAANSTAGWSCADGSPAGTACVYQVGNLAAGAGGSVTYAVTVVSPLPANVTQIDNTARINDDGSQGPDPTPENNVDTEDTPVVQNLGPDLRIDKTDGGIATRPGGTVPYRLDYRNISSNINATGVVISEIVPANTTFNAAGSTAGWSCADGSPAGTACVYQVGNLAAGAGGTVIFALTVGNPLPAGVTQIDNAARINDDGSQGPDPTPQNNVSADNTPLTPGTPKDGRRGGGGGGGDDDGGKAVPPASPPPSSPPAAVQPTPTLPVLFLPETGEKQVSPAETAGSGGQVAWAVLLLGAGAVTTYTLRRIRGRSKD